MNTPALSLAPVRTEDRIVAIDALRGFALFGILLVNMELFAHPLQTLLFPIDPTVSAINRFFTWLVRFVAEGRAYC
jgi:uncharacterized protein